jgi:hypothetical protein
MGRDREVVRSYDDDKTRPLKSGQINPTLARFVQEKELIIISRVEGKGRGERRGRIGGTVAAQELGNGEGVVDRVVTEVWPN